MDVLSKLGLNAQGKPLIVEEKKPAHPTRVYFKISYGQKEHAKALGARWDNTVRMWYGEGDTVDDLAQHYSPADSSASASAPSKPVQRLYLNVPFAHKGRAKELGAKWDPHAKKWYAPDDKIEALSEFR